MKEKLLLIPIFAAMFSTVSVANDPNVSLPRAGWGSTQLVTIMNSLANPAALNITKSDVMVKYYDGTGTKPPCWTEYKIAYHAEPLVAGAGGRNGCGVAGVTPPAIVAIDVIPLKSALGKIYNDMIGIVIDPNKFYNNIIIEQDQAPVFNQNGTLQAPGTLKVTQFAEGEGT